MHTALCIPELVLQVTPLLEKHDQVHLAWTCKSLFNVIIPGIWRTVTTTKALRSPLPANLELPTDDDVIDFIQRPRSLPYNDWVPLLTYAPKIRHLKLSDTTHDKLGRPQLRGRALQRTLAVVCSFADLAKSFRNLNSLDLTLIEMLSGWAALPLFSLPVKTLQVSFRGIDPYYWSYIQETVFPTFSPCIVDCHVWVEGPIEESNGVPRHIEEQLRAIVRRMSKLKKGFFAALGYGTVLMPALAALPALEDIEVELDPPGPTPDYSLPPNAFARLKRLVLRSMDNPYHPIVAVLLEQVTAPSLEELSFVSLDFCVPSALRVVARKWASSILSLNIGMADWVRSHPNPFTFSEIVLMPLSYCGHLHTLTVSGAFLILTDNDPEVMAAAWPSMKRLSLGCESFGKTWRTPVTRSSLIVFAKQLPNLRSLDMCVDMDNESLNLEENEPSIHTDFGRGLTDESPLQGTPTGPISPSHLQHLRLDSKYCSDAVKATNFLRRWFPSLRSFFTISDNHNMKELEKILGLKQQSSLPDDGL